MSSPRPPLKAGVDLQLQSAYDEGNWTAVVRLAEKRARSLKDQHSEVLKVCAESQLGTPVEKSSAVLFARGALRDGTVIKDAESLHMLDWACLDMMPESFFSEVLGPLRVRLVKANAKDRMSVVSCLEDCLLHWDLNSAQQIAAILDRTFPQVRKFLFWNIVTTYMLSSSDQCPQDKKFLYRELSVKQALKAAQVAEQALERNEKAAPARGIKSEEEILLLFDMLKAKGDVTTWKGVLESPLLSPLKLFKKGQKDVFLRTVSVFARFGEWQLLYSLIMECLSHKDEGGRLSSLASDWTIWKRFVEAAGHIQDSQPDVIEAVFGLIKAHACAKKMAPIYVRTLMLARIHALFELGNGIEPPTSFQPRESARPREVIRYVEDQYESPSCFEDIRGFVERLNSGELDHLVYEQLPQIASEAEGYKSFALKSLLCKLRYFILSIPQGQFLGARRGHPKDVLVRVAREALGLYRALEKSNAADEEVGRAQIDFLSDLAVVSAMCFVKLSGLGLDQGLQGSNQARTYGQVPATGHRFLMLGANILEHQLLLSPKHSGILLLLVRLYLRLGIAKRATELWELLEVKRTIVDSLSPIFFDRLSGIAPGIASGHMLSSVVQSHYTTSLRLRMPRRLTDAFEEEAYTSILEIPKYMDSLRTSCTMVMGYLEERRALRASGGKAEGLTASLLGDITDETNLSGATDYGSFPNFESSLAPPMQEILSVGPGLSNARSHLGLLAEQYFSLLSFKSPTMHKPASAAQASAADHAFVVESLAQLGNSLGKFLEAGSQQLTAHEKIFYGVLNLLASIVVESVKATRSAPPNVAFGEYVTSVTSSIELLLDLTAGGIAGESPTRRVLSTMSSLCDISQVRDAAIAVKVAAAYVSSHNDRQKERDRSGESCLRKEVVAGMKALEVAAKEALNEAKSWMAAAKKDVGQPAFVQQLKELVLGTEGRDRDLAYKALEDAFAKIMRAEGDSEVNIWAKKVADGWRHSVNGWEHVRWE